MSDACANPDCGHGPNAHVGYKGGCGLCTCPAFVADWGRPEPFPPAVASDAITQTIADRAVTDALAKVLAEQRWQGHRLILNGWSERTRQEVASTLAAVLSERFVITPRENT